MISNPYQMDTLLTDGERARLSRIFFSITFDGKKLLNRRLKKLLQLVHELALDLEFRLPTSNGAVCDWQFILKQGNQEISGILGSPEEVIIFATIWTKRQQAMKSHKLI